tara:strand:- start:107 stop:463 length:357 start_codon:yes stop_codon:yes gene_type:complete
MISEKEYNQLKVEYDHPDNQDHALLSYVYRCFWVGDEEEYQLDPDDSDILMAMNKWVEGATEVFQKWYSLETGKIGTSETLLELLEGYIWNPELFDKDEDLWEAIVCDHNYNEYKELQ